MYIIKFTFFTVLTISQLARGALCEQSTPSSSKSYGSSKLEVMTEEPLYYGFAGWRYFYKVKDHNGSKAIGLKLDSTAICEHAILGTS